MKRMTIWLLLAALLGLGIGAVVIAAETEPTPKTVLVRGCFDPKDHEVIITDPGALKVDTTTLNPSSDANFECPSGTHEISWQVLEGD
jgi:hypothetical protein